MDLDKSPYNLNQDICHSGRQWRPSFKAAALCVQAAVRLGRITRKSQKIAESTVPFAQSPLYCYYMIPGVGRIRIDVPCVNRITSPSTQASTIATSKGQKGGPASGATKESDTAIVSSERTHAALMRLMACISTGGYLIPASKSDIETIASLGRENTSVQDDKENYNGVIPRTFVSTTGLDPPVTGSIARVPKQPLPSSMSFSSFETLAFGGATTGDILETLIMSNAETSFMWRNRYVIHINRSLYIMR